MKTSSDPLLSLRAAVVVLAAVVTGLVAGGLSYLDGSSVAGALLWGGGAVGGTLVLLQSVIE